MSQLEQPRAYRTSPRTVRANALLNDAGVLLEKVAEENTGLHVELENLRQKVSSADRRVEYLLAALAAAEQGAFKTSSVVEFANRWQQEGKDPSYYAELYSMSANRGFVAPQSVDKTSSAGQTEDNSPFGRDHFDYSRLRS